jgi:hypothetical protein
VAYAVLVPFTRRISDYCFCFALSRGVHGPAAPAESLSTFTNYRPYRPRRAARAARTRSTALPSRRVERLRAVWRVLKRAKGHAGEPPADQLADHLTSSGRISERAHVAEVWNLI